MLKIPMLCCEPPSSSWHDVMTTGVLGYGFLSAALALPAHSWVIAKLDEIKKVLKNDEPTMLEWSIAGVVFSSLTLVGTTAIGLIIKGQRE
jgi:hypothetical protein